MKTKIFLAASLFLGASMTIIGCSKDDAQPTPTPKTNTITDVVVGAADFSTLKAAVEKAELGTTLSGAGPFTVFAPDNDAFAASGITSAVLSSLSKAEVSRILLYHTLAGRVPAANVPAGPNAPVPTASTNDTVYVTKNVNGVFVNGIKVSQADIAADNGVIHRLTRVLMPAKGNIVATASAAGSGLDSLVKAVVRANNAPGGDTSLITTLSNARITVFAPTNAAFTELVKNILNVNSIDDIPVSQLLAVLRFHVVDGRAFSSDLSNGNLTMLAGGTTTVNLTNGNNNGPTIKGNGNGTNKANIGTTNIMATNGVVHVIDRVLLP